MPFVLPTFNLAVGVWHDPVVPPAPPSLVTIGNLSPGRLISMVGFSGGTNPGGWLFTVLLRLPPLADVRSAWQSPMPDIVDVPLGSGRFYRVFQVEDVGKGFVNEHRLAYLSPMFSSDPLHWPTPYP